MQFWIVGRCVLFCSLCTENTQKVLFKLKEQVYAPYAFPLESLAMKNSLINPHG